MKKPHINRWWRDDLWHCQVSIHHGLGRTLREAFELCMLAKQRWNGAAE